MLPPFQEALAGFYRETGEAALETEGFFQRNGTTLALLHDKYKVRVLRPGVIQESPHWTRAQRDCFYGTAIASPPARTGEIPSQDMK